MIDRDNLAHYLNDYLSCSEFDDYAPNGLQIEGKAHIRSICTAVTASEEIVNKAIVLKADALLVHHGFFWRGEEACLTGAKKKRISPFIINDINLYSYHLPLDCHLEIGNNACLAKILGLNNIKSHTVKNIPHLLWSGEFEKALSAEDLSLSLRQKLHREPMVVSGSGRRIQKIAWCTGAAQDFIEEAKKLGVDAYLSGEISLKTYYQAQELNMHYFSCGHHASERFGIQALGQHLSAQFEVEHQFIDSHNPV